MSHKVNHIIFDLTGVVFISNRFQQLRTLGLLQSCMYIVTHRKNPVSRFLQILEKLHTLEPDGYPIIYYKNKPLPRPISDLMCGHITSDQAVESIKHHIEQLIQENYFTSQRETKLMEHILSMLVQPQGITTALKPNKKLIKIIQQLKQRGYTLYLLTNFDSHSFQQILQRYPTIFDLFNHTIVSSHIHHIKPYTAIYEHLLTTYAICPKQSLFIDDQYENIIGAQQSGIQAIHYTNLDKLLKHLKNYNIDFK